MHPANLNVCVLRRSENVSWGCFSLDVLSYPINNPNERWRSVSKVFKGSNYQYAVHFFVRRHLECSTASANRNLVKDFQGNDS